MNLFASIVTRMAVWLDSHSLGPAFRITIELKDRNAVFGAQMAVKRDLFPQDAEVSAATGKITVRGIEVIFVPRQAHLDRRDGAGITHTL